MKRLQRLCLNHKSSVIARNICDSAEGRIRPLANAGNDNSYFHRKDYGLTLAELIVALAIIPGLLLAASTFYIHVARAMQETTDQGNAMTHREQIVNMLQRYIANGTSAEIIGSGGNDLKVFLPENQEDEYLFVNSPSLDEPSHLFINGAPISFSGTSNMNKYAGYISKQEDGPPFSFKIVNGIIDPKTITVKLKFHTLPDDPPQCTDTNPNFSNCPTNITFDVKLRGGEVAP